ncbi:hypothetical protein [Caulobacter sp. DWR1-3-2b1]|uniref:hypothetical protein n=1 Tax=Caulobacter sp. DWR1-3-2b1 TaxID=2804670 RepID=UPI003CF0DCF3
MKKFGLILALAAALPVSALVSVNAAVAQEDALSKAMVGKLLFDADGKKLAAIYKLDPKGSPQLLLDGKMVTVPLATMKKVEDKFATSLTKRDLMTAP